MVGRAQPHKELVLGAANLDVNQYGMERNALVSHVTTAAVMFSSSSIADNLSIRAAAALWQLEEEMDAHEKIAQRPTRI